MFTFPNLGYYKGTIIDVLVINTFVNYYLHYTKCGGLDMYPRKTHWCIRGPWITAFGSNIKLSVVLDLATFRIFIFGYYALNLPFHTRKSNCLILSPAIILLFLFNRRSRNTFRRFDDIVERDCKSTTFSRLFCNGICGPVAVAQQQTCNESEQSQQP